MRQTVRFSLAVLLLYTAAVRAAEVQSTLGQKIVAFCEEHKDQQVGRGECCDLASAALKQAGAKGRGKDAPEGGDYTWGRLALLVEAGDDSKDGPKLSGGAASDLRLGDIIQFREAKFVHRKGRGSSILSFGHHTAVVASLEDNGATVHVFQQNCFGKKYVITSTLRLGELKKGWLRFYRPQARAGAD